MIFPDYKNSIKNVSASFSKFLGVEDGSTIFELDKELEKKYKNVVFIVFDGMGVDVLKKIAPNSIMMKNTIKTITSVFPSTTTNATTTLLTNKLVDEHKFLAWCMYFKKLNRCVDIYMGTDTYTKEVVDDYLNTDTTPYFNKIKANRKICSVFPSFINKNVAPTNICANTIDELGKGIVEICKDDNDKFVYCYCTEPDSTMHEFGVTSNEAIAKLKEINDTLNYIVNNTKDTLLVLTADHGHFDVKGYIDLYKDESVMNCLERPLSMEPRATSYKLKPNKEKEFLKLMEKYKDDIFLVKSEELIQKGVFGNNVDEELKDFLGDYIGIGTNSFKLVRFCEDKIKFKGHHTSLTEEEMLVPLIFIKNK